MWLLWAKEASDFALALSLTGHNSAISRTLGRRAPLASSSASWTSGRRA